MKGFHFPSTRTTNSVLLILGTQYSLCENYIKQARLHWGLKHVLDTNLIPLRTKFDKPTKRMPAWPVISQLWLPERHFSANGISLRLGEVQMKICKGWLQALLSSAPRGFAARSRVLARLVSLAQIGELARRLYTTELYVNRTVFLFKTNMKSTLRKTDFRDIILCSIPVNYRTVCAYCKRNNSSGIHQVLQLFHRNKKKLSLYSTSKLTRQRWLIVTGVLSNVGWPLINLS